MLRSYFFLVGGLLTGAFLFAALLATGASAGMSQDLASCTAAKDRSAAAACTRVMKSGRLPDSQMYIGYFNRGTTWRRLGESAKAVEDFTKVLELKPGFARAFEARGMAQADSGAHAAAMADLDEAVKRGGDDWRFLYSRAVVLRSEGDSEAALSDLSAAGNLKQDGAQVVLMRALILADQGDDAGAGVQISQAPSKGREEALISYTRAAVAFRAGRIAEADADVDRAIALRGDLAAARTLKGRILEARGEPAAARTSYAKALVAVQDSFDGFAARRLANERLAVLGRPAPAKGGRDVAEVKLETRPLDCKVFLPATGSVVTAKCSE